MRKLLLIVMIAGLSSCYSYTVTVGDGGTGNTTRKGKNHYLVEGLFNIGTTDYQVLAGNNTDYTVTIKHNFIDLVLTGITLGIYTPTTTIVTY